MSIELNHLGKRELSDNSKLDSKQPARQNTTNSIANFKRIGMFNRKIHYYIDYMI
jgi:hypothetical protein